YLIFDLLGECLASSHVSDDLGTLAARQAIEREHRHTGAPDPWWRELWPKRDYHQHTKCWHPINKEIEVLACRGITPMHVLPHRRPRLAHRQPFELRHLRLKRLLLALLGGEIEGRITVARWDR